MKALTDEILCEVDDRNISEGKPVLSVMVVHDDGAVSTAFWQTVKKHNLRLPNESDQDCIARLRRITTGYYQKHKE